MNHEQFKQITTTRVNHCLTVLNAKGEEYSRDGERLHNFKKSGRRQGCTPEKALRGMWEKHLVSIDDIIDDLDANKTPTRKMLDEKITDAINYLLLLEGLIQERIDKNPQQTHLGDPCIFCDTPHDSVTPGPCLGTAPTPYDPQN